MPPLNMHLLIGERLFPTLRNADCEAHHLAPFLAGNIIVDANSFTELSRPDTHLVERQVEAEGHGYRRFLDRRPTLLRRPWAEMTREERALAAGYLTHLIADAIWKAELRKLYRRLGIRHWREMPVPAGVFLTEVSILCAERFGNFPQISRALQRYPRIPDLFTHVPHEALQRTWAIGREVMQRPYTRASYYKMLRLKGIPSAQLRVIEAQHERYGDMARDFILDMANLDLYLQRIIAHAEAILPTLWNGSTTGHRVAADGDPSDPRKNAVRRDGAAFGPGQAALADAPAGRR